MEPTMWSPQEFVHTNLSLNKSNFAQYYVKLICQIHPKKGLLLNLNFPVMEPPWKLVLEPAEEFKREIFIYMKIENQGRFSHASVPASLLQRLVGSWAIVGSDNYYL